MKKIVIAASPFGYGPAAKALLIAESLAEIAEITIISKGDTYQFIRKYSGPAVTCLSGNFQTVFNEHKLGNQDYFICIGNEPAVIYLISIGYQSRVIFLDFLLPWRVRNEGKVWHHPVRLYLVEDFPGSLEYLSTCRAGRVELVAPIINQPPARAGQPVPKGKVILSLGGLTSPLISWEVIKPVVEEIINGVSNMVRTHNRTVDIIGSTWTRDIDQKHNAGVNLLADVSNRDVTKMISQSELVISTPGLGIIYESIACKVPVVLLPLLNSTGVFQSKVFLQYGFNMTLQPSMLTEMFEVLEVSDWHDQTAVCLRWAKANQKRLLAGLPEIMNMLFNGGPVVRDRFLATQGAFVDSLSKKDALSIIQEVIS